MADRRTSDSLGFIGLGVMGGAMCANLAAGHKGPVLAFDRDSGRLQAAVEAGAVAARSVDAVGAQAGIVFLVLPGEAEVRDVCLGKYGLCSGARPGQLIVDCSTVPVALSRELAVAAAARGAAFADAPIAGTWQQAPAREISLLLGAEAAVFARLRPHLRRMARHVMRCGDVGSGITVKLLLNMVLAESVVALAEALALARRSGVEGEVLFEALGRGCDSFALHQHGMTALLPDTFPEGRFPTRYMLKDLDYLVRHADGLGLSMPGLEVARALLRASAAAGNADAYWPAFIRVLENR